MKFIIDFIARPMFLLAPQDFQLFCDFYETLFLSAKQKVWLIVFIIALHDHETWRLTLLASFCCPQEHVNLVGRDGENGPVLVSVKAETVAGQEHWRVLLRLRAGSTHDLVPAANLTSNPTPSKMVKVKTMILSGSRLTRDESNLK